MATREDIEKLSKNELEELARVFGVEFDKRYSKKFLVGAILNIQGIEEYQLSPDEEFIETVEFSADEVEVLKTEEPESIALEAVKARKKRYWAC